MPIQPWYKVVTPREDLREGRPMDASEFAVHLDQVRDNRAPGVYTDPVQFFERTYVTKNLETLIIDVMRRLNGIKVETSAVFNLATQFGGGKTHALTLLFHLARGAERTRNWRGVQNLMDAAGVKQVPKAATAVFVGTEFDSFQGRGGGDGTPLRKTPWGEMAWQLMGTEGFALVAQHEASIVAPGGDVLERLIPREQPVLILMDELMNYVSRTRSTNMVGQLYSFLHNLSEVIRSRDNAVLAVSIPASELEMTADDQSDYERFKKLLDRVGKPIILSAEAETSEIIRRRLFEWHGLPVEANKVGLEYATWMQAHKQQLPDWFPMNAARETLAATYPFHPSVLSVFERKWQSLPRFQQTRGVLRLLALWVSKAYVEGFKGAHKDPLITLGTAPLEDPMFRSALFEQLGETKLEGAVTTDIVGKDHAHAIRLDAGAQAAVRKARLHRKIATTIFFESNGGQQRCEASLPEVRLAVAEPDLDIGNVEQCVEALTDACYYLAAEKNRYRFSLHPNLNKLLADRRASISDSAIKDRVRSEVMTVFTKGKGVERAWFPEKSNDIPDAPLLRLVVIAPELSASEPGTTKFLQTMTTEHGASSRTFKSGLLWAAVEDASLLRDDARKLLAWEDIRADASNLRMDDDQRKQLETNLLRARSNLTEAVWRSYRNVFLLDENNSLRRIDLGIVNSSQAESLVGLILQRLQQEDLVVDGVSANFLVRNWAPALPEWSTRQVRDAFFASPKFPRLLRPDMVRMTISRAVVDGILAYVGKAGDGKYEPFVFKKAIREDQVEVSDDMYVIRREDAEAYLASAASSEAALPAPLPFTLTAKAAIVQALPTTSGASPAKARTDVPSSNFGAAASTPQTVPGFQWDGDVPAQKWMNFYTKVLARFATSGGLKLRVSVESHPHSGVTAQSLEEVRVALRELGLSEAIQVSHPWALPAGSFPEMDLGPEAALMILALLRANGRSISTVALARCLVLRCHPDILVRLAPSETKAVAEKWGANAGPREVPRGFLRGLLAELEGRGAIELAIDANGQTVVKPGEFANRIQDLDPWITFSATFLLAILDGFEQTHTLAGDPEFCHAEALLLAEGIR